MSAAGSACPAPPPCRSVPCLPRRYYSGEKKAPVLTVFIGGNHEASNHLQELPYGGWVKVILVRFACFQKTRFHCVFLLLCVCLLLSWPFPGMG